MQGIDISWWQKDNYKYLIDTYAKDFVIARASFDFNVDSTCDMYYQYAKKKGLQLGVYFFPLTESSDAVTSAKWCVNQVKGYLHEAVFFLDWEATQGNDVSKTWWALEWLKTFEKEAGVKPNIYMNTSTVNSFNWTDVAKNDNGLWLADYGRNDGNDYGVPDIPYWQIVMAHQYTSVGDNGAGLDRDVFFGDKTAWQKYANVVNNTTPSKPSEKPKTDSKEYYTVKAGDSMWAIANKYGMSLNSLIALNPQIENPNLIYPNQKIRVK